MSKVKIAGSGIEIDYRDEGTGLPIVFFHAFALNQTMWDEQAGALRNRFRVITLDLRGFGGSAVQNDLSTMPEMAADARELLSALAIEKAIIVGLSMGGYVALAFYREYRDAVLALVLADTRATRDTPEARERRLLSAERAECDGASVIADEMTPMLLGDTTLATRPEIVSRVHAMIAASSPFGLAAAQRGMAERQDSTDLLAQITCPALVMVGDEDKLSSLAEAEFTHKGINGSQFCVIEKAGHLSNMEQPEAFNKALVDFVG